MADSAGAPQTRISHAEIGAGLFLSFALALFCAMLFVMGHVGRSWRGHRVVKVLFTRTRYLAPGSPVCYHGMDIGSVKKIDPVRLDDNVLARMPVITRKQLRNLPLFKDEIQALESLPDSVVNGEARRLLIGRHMVMLTMDLLLEHDERRYREDDGYKVRVSYMGDSAVDILTGNGLPLTHDSNKIMLGTSGDLYTDLNDSLRSVKNILNSLADTVGGRSGQSALRGQLRNFDRFTADLDEMLARTEKQAGRIFDETDTAVKSTNQAFIDTDAKLSKNRELIETALKNGSKAIVDAQLDAAESLKNGSKKITEYHDAAKESLKNIREGIAPYKESIPGKIKEFNDGAKAALARIDALDTALANAEVRMANGAQMVQGGAGSQMDTALNIEALTWKLKTKPWAMLEETPPEEKPELRGAQDRLEIAKRNYLELRGELKAARQSMSTTNSSDRTRLELLDRALAELDSIFVKKVNDANATSAQSPDKSKSGDKKSAAQEKKSKRGER